MAVVTSSLLIMTVPVTAHWICCGSRQHLANRYHSALANIVASDKNHIRKVVAVNPRMNSPIQAVVILGGFLDRHRHASVTRRRSPQLGIPSCSVVNCGLCIVSGSTTLYA